jgi:DNA-binding CsgD family transcriptional regulator
MRYKGVFARRMPLPLEYGRELFERGAWREAYETLGLADRAAPLAADDLERLATAAYLLGLDDDFHRLLDRAHQAHAKASACERAARCAFWLGLTLLFRGKDAQAGAWLARARRLVEGRDCVEQGYLLLPEAEGRLARREDTAAQASARRAASVGERFGDADLVACARHLEGRALIQQGQVPAGLALLDETMLAAVNGELSPMVTGLMYCSVIDACQRVHALRRAAEWTSALARWCERQPDMIAFSGTCLLHRAEILQFHGAWGEAMVQVEHACERFSHYADAQPPAAAFYRQAEVHRLRGELAASEQAYRRAARLGYEPQPGLALLRLAQGRTDAASAAISRLLRAASGRETRVKLLPAYFEIMLAAGRVADARSAAAELEQLACALDTDVLRAMAGQALGAVELAQGNVQAAFAALKAALALWLQLEAPYEAARVRVLLGLACGALGDQDASELELDTARDEFERLGAATDVANLRALAQTPQKALLTSRELEVLRLVAAGKTNKAIARHMSLSERTIDRHVSNILAKLDVPSRAGATAYAYDHRLL